MGLNIKDISDIIRKQIKEYDQKIKFREEGSVISVGDGIALVDGLDNAIMGELLIFHEGTLGLILNLEEGAVGVVLMGPDSHIKEGSTVKRTRKIIETGIGDKLLGRVVNAISVPIDDLGSIKFEKKMVIEKIAPGVMTRQSVDQPLETGIIAIDAMIPIGKGQRELIIGDRQTGKTAIAIDAILNQKGKDVICIYVAIGQKSSTLAQVVEKLKANGSLEYTVIISATASEPPPLQYLSPYTGITIAEGFMAKGKDVLIVFDDLSKHAVAYRTMSLLLRRPPGREAYPGDVFYLHSRLLERSCRLNKSHGGGSITALPIIETQAGDISAYIPTNVISITDGQIFLNTDQFNANLRPAVDVGLSVSRVGSAAQKKLIKQVSSQLKLQLAQYRELQAFAQFSSDLDANTKKIIEHGKRVIQILKQQQYSPLSQINQSLILLSVKKKRIQWIPIEMILDFKNEIIAFFDNNKGAKKIKEEVSTVGAYTSETEKKADNIIIKLVSKFVAKIPNYSYKDFGTDNEWAIIEREE